MSSRDSRIAVAKPVPCIVSVSALASQQDLWMNAFGLALSLVADHVATVFFFKKMARGHGNWAQHEHGEVI